MRIVAVRFGGPWVGTRRYEIDSGTRLGSLPRCSRGCMRRLVVIAFAVVVLAACASPQWLTYHHDAARTGDVGGAKLLPVAHAWTTTLDGPVYGQPVVVTG